MSDHDKPVPSEVPPASQPGDPMENWLMGPSLEWLEQAEHGADQQRCKMIADMLRDLWRRQSVSSAPSATVPFVERSESVNLARNIVEREVPLTEVTQVGIACLADAVLRMDAALRAAAGNHERNGE